MPFIFEISEAAFAVSEVSFYGTVEAIDFSVTLLSASVAPLLLDWLVSFPMLTGAVFFSIALLLLRDSDKAAVINPGVLWGVLVGLLMGIFMGIFMSILMAAIGSTAVRVITSSKERMTYFLFTY